MSKARARKRGPDRKSLSFLTGTVLSSSDGETSNFGNMWGFLPIRLGIGGVSYNALYPVGAVVHPHAS